MTKGARNLLTSRDKFSTCSATRYTKCYIISRQNKKIQTEISHQQNIGVQNYKRTYITVLKFLSRNEIKILFHKHFNLFLDW